MKIKKLFITALMASVLFTSTKMAYATEETKVEFNVKNGSSTTTYVYKLSDLSCGYIDEEGNLVEVPITYAYNVMEATIAPGITFEWYPTNDKNGFKLKKNDVVTISLNLNTGVRIRIGLTNGNSKETTDKNPSVSLVQSKDGYSKMYVENLSSSTVKVKSGTISYNE